MRAALCLPVAATGPTGVPKAVPNPGRPQKKPLIQISQKNSAGDGAPKLRKRDMLLGLLGAATLPCGCPQPAHADGPGIWEYGDLEGPKKWGSMCAMGEKQSPIDLPLPGGTRKTMGKKVRLTMDYSMSAQVQVVNTGHGNVQVNVPMGSFCTLDGKRLQLLQWHFHTPSEHAFDGNREAMEIHLVHRDINSGELAVLGVLLKRGASNTFKALQLALEHAPSRPGQPLKVAEPLNLNSVLGAAFPGEVENVGSCAHYIGSLTTPPCTEGVQWYVWMEPASVTDTQVLDFQQVIMSRRSMSTNARGIQWNSSANNEIEIM